VGFIVPVRMTFAWSTPAAVRALGRFRNHRVWCRRGGRLLWCRIAPLPTPGAKPISISEIDRVLARIWGTGTGVQDFVSRH